MDPVPPVEAVQLCHQELLEILLALLLATREQVDQWAPQVEEVEYLHLAGLDSTARTAGALVVSRRQSLAMSLVPGNLLHWPVWFTGTFTARTGVGVGNAHTATVGAGRRTRHIQEIRLLRDWLVRLHVLHAPTVGQAPEAAPPVQTRSAVPAAARVAGE